MNSSSQIHHKKLAAGILLELNKIYIEFSLFQEKSNLPCPTGCGKCCFKSDIYCTPIELLPMALDLLERKIAKEMYEKCLEHSADHCLFMLVSDREKGLGKCTEYIYRPLVCRTFGVAGKHDKNNKVAFSVCTTLREKHPESYDQLINSDLKNEKIPFINNSKNKLFSFDPSFMEKELPINQALAVILNKVIFYSELNSGTDNSNS
jgi:Fe-S-cluster containining protein